MMWKKGEEGKICEQFHPLRVEAFICLHYIYISTKIWLLFCVMSLILYINFYIYIYLLKDLHLMQHLFFILFKVWFF